MSTDLSGKAKTAWVDRRELLTAMAAASTVLTVGEGKAVAEEASAPAPGRSATAAGKISTEIVDQNILLIGIEGSEENRITVDMFRALGGAYHRLENDKALRVAVLHGQGPDFCGGLDVRDWGVALGTGPLVPNGSDFINPVATVGTLRSKPVVVAVQGLTAMLGHELMLAADIRVAAANSRFHQGEVARGLYPGGGATIRMVREAGWGNAMRYMLTGDEWDAEEARRLGFIQEITPVDQQVEGAMKFARKIAKAAPLGIQATLQSQQTLRTEGEQAAFAALLPKFGGLFRTEDFKERQVAARQNRPPVYVGR
jgi:enoyl-CoA hydratase/carnithine racemase